MMPNFGFQPGILDYWMLLTDWRNGTFAMLLALGVLLVGCAVATRHQMQAAEGPRPLKGAHPSASFGSMPGEKRPPGSHVRSGTEAAQNTGSALSASAETIP
jgi:hypothetical protein